MNVHELITKLQNLSDTEKELPIICEGNYGDSEVMAVSIQDAESEHAYVLLENK